MPWKEGAPRPSRYPAAEAAHPQAERRACRDAPRGQHLHRTHPQPSARGPIPPAGAPRPRDAVRPPPPRAPVPRPRAREGAIIARAASKHLKTPQNGAKISPKWPRTRPDAELGEVRGCAGGGAGRAGRVGGLRPEACSGCEERPLRAALQGPAGPGG